MTDQNTPDAAELHARFADMEATYKELLAGANGNVANLNVMLKATQRELSKAMEAIAKLEKAAVDARAKAEAETKTETNVVDLPNKALNGHAEAMSH